MGVRTKRKLGKTDVSGLTFERAKEIIINMKKVEGKSERTVLAYERLFTDFERFFISGEQISTLTNEDARNFIKWQLEDKIQYKNAMNRTDKKNGVSISTVNTYLKLAKSAFQNLVDDGLIDDNPFKNLKNIKQQTKEVEVMTINQVKSILKAFDKSWYTDFRDYVLCNVLLDTFGRIDEVCKLKKTDVDFIGEVITFSKTKNSKFRHVPVTRKVLKLIEELNRETEEFHSEYIFLNNKGGVLRTDSFRSHLKDVAIEAGVSIRIYPHLFRHTASTLFLAGGGNIRTLQKILGHSSINTTLIYAHVLPETIKDQHGQFNPLKMINESPTIKTKRKNLT